jgi:hypothetical protein
MEEATLETAIQNTEGGSFEQPLYKEWFKTKAASGFISITPWRTARKVVVEIGSIGADNSVTSATKCYVDAFDLALYLRMVTLGRGDLLYPKRHGVYSPESFIQFGGSAGATPIARVFKVEFWGANSENIGDPTGFAWKCGHFDGTVTDSGAIQPNYSKPRSGDKIKRTRLQMAEISSKMDLLLIGWAAQDPNWYHSD